MKDYTNHLIAAKHFLLTGKFLPSIRPSQKNGIRKFSKKLHIKDDQLYYTGIKNGKNRQVLLTLLEKKRVFDENHLDKEKNKHRGLKSTIAQIIQQYYWLNMREEIRQMFVNCVECEDNPINFNIIPNVQSNSQSITPTKSWQYVNMDFLGQFPVSKEGYVYAVVFIDKISHYTHAIPVRDTLVKEVAEAILKTIFTFSPPIKILSDQKPAFVTEINKIIHENCGLSNLVKSVQKNQITSENQSYIKYKILESCMTVGDTWNQQLLKTIFVLNTDSEREKEESPYREMYNRCPLLCPSLGDHTTSRTVYQTGDGEVEVVANGLEDSSKQTNKSMVIVE